jgi:hypothetical protein
MTASFWKTDPHKSIDSHHDDESPYEMHQISARLDEGDNSKFGFDTAIDRKTSGRHLSYGRNGRAEVKTGI